MIVLVGALWASGSPGLPIERRKRRDSRLSAGKPGTANEGLEPYKSAGTPGPLTQRRKRRKRRLSAGIAGSTLRAPKLSSTTPEEKCVEVPVALHTFVWGVFIYNHDRRIFEYCFERDHPFRSPKERLMSCDSPIAICGMNATCGFSSACVPSPIVTQLPNYLPHSQTYECIFLYLYAISRVFFSGSSIATYCVFAGLLWLAAPLLR